VRSLYERIAELTSAGETIALLKVVAVEGSAPQEVGAALLLREDGSFEGTIGGGAIEARALQDAAQLLAKRRSSMMRYNLGAELGMCCGGIMHVFCEVLEPTRRLLLFGGGHVAQPTAGLAARVGFQVWLVEERREWGNPERFPQAHRILNLPVEEALDELGTTRRDFVVVVTRGHEQDQQVLEHYVAGDPPFYLGVIGSRSKVARAIARCRARGLRPDNLARVRMPIGLDVGAVTPDEIAVAIVAELIAHHRGRAQRIFPATMAALNPLHADRAPRAPAADSSPADAARPQSAADASECTPSTTQPLASDDED
jgi:xanthine dehydrogenase accessory factor